MLNDGSHHHALTHVSSHTHSHTHVVTHVPLGKFPCYATSSSPARCCIAPSQCLSASLCHVFLTLLPVSLTVLFPHICRDPVFPAAVVKEAMLSLMHGFDIFVGTGWLHCISLSLGPLCLWLHSWFCTSAFVCNGSVMQLELRDFVSPC